MEGRYVDILKDCGFKAVFGDERNKSVIIAFLNAVLDGEKTVSDVEFMNNEVFGKTMESKSVRFDLHCRDESGCRFVVEMQKIRHSADFFQRSVFYGTKLYEFQQNSGSQTYDVPPVYVIGIMEGNLLHETPRADSCISRYKLTENQFQIIAPPTISCIFVQLGFFRKEERECHTLLDKWCYSLKHMGTMTCPPDGFASDVFNDLFHASEIANFDKKKYIQYQQEAMTEKDYYHDLYYSKLEGREEGKAEGKAEGKLEGRAEANIETARSLKSLGVSDDIIVKSTGLTPESVAAL